MTGAGWRRELRRATSYHRRLLVAGLAAGAVAAGLSALSPDGPPMESVLVAAADLTGGRPVGADDVRPAALPLDAVPEGALTSPDQVVGRVLAGPARRGEPLTDVRLVGPSLLAGFGDDLVGVPVRVADADVAGLLRPGDVVDVVAADTSLSAGTATVTDARTVARAVPVVAVPRGGDAWASPGSADGALLVLATRPEVAAELARAAVTARLSVTLRPD